MFQSGAVGAERLSSFPRVLSSGLAWLCCMGRKKAVGRNSSRSSECCSVTVLHGRAVRGSSRCLANETEEILKYLLSPFANHDKRLTQTYFKVCLSKYHCDRNRSTLSLCGCVCVCVCCIPTLL